MTEPGGTGAAVVDDVDLRWSAPLFAAGVTVWLSPRIRDPTFANHRPKPRSSPDLKTRSKIRTRATAWHDGYYSKSITTASIAGSRNHPPATSGPNAMRPEKELELLSRQWRDGESVRHAATPRKCSLRSESASLSRADLYVAKGNAFSHDRPRRFVTTPLHWRSKNHRQKLLEHLTETGEL